jgi:hypothetical protein
MSVQNLAKSKRQQCSPRGVISFWSITGGAVAQLGARLDGIEEVVGSNPIGSTNLFRSSFELANESSLCVLQRPDGSLASDGGKILEKLI